MYTVECGALEGRLIRLATTETEHLIVDFTAEIDGLPDTCGMSDVAIYEPEMLDDLAAIVGDLRRELRRLMDGAQ
ncbi:hypothetical protein A5724_10485 [Mycobacterium sp. ACS1612]|nr:hypothetical protein A5724_10485 [Mycobacterium sp. ACS1612]